jgi:hemerythrin-like metal-binding protein
MELFKWDEKYSVNNDELDNHHKVLFGILNRLYASCFEENEGITLDSIYEESVSYTNYHFSAEENYMRNKGYKDIDNHIKAHNIFKERIMLLKKDIDLKNIVLTKELIVYLGNWLLNHVLVEDKKYSMTPVK